MLHRLFPAAHTNIDTKIDIRIDAHASRDCRPRNGNPGVWIAAYPASHSSQGASLWMDMIYPSIARRSIAFIVLRANTIRTFTYSRCCATVQVLSALVVRQKRLLIHRVQAKPPVVDACPSSLIPTAKGVAAPRNREAESETTANPRASMIGDLGETGPSLTAYVELGQTGELHPPLNQFIGQLFLQTGNTNGRF